MIWLNIPDITRQIKNPGHSGLYIVALVLLVGISSFGLGRLSADVERRVPMRLYYPEKASLSAQRMSDDENVGVAPEGAIAGVFVGSKNGNKYHFPWCSGAKRISSKNAVWFSTKAEAERAGYTPASNCKGL